MSLKSMYIKGQGIIEKVTKLDQSRKHGQDYLLCNAIFSNVFLSIDGYATPCCMNQKYKLGDYRVQPLAEIWNGEAAEEFRSLIKNNIFPKGCERCRESATLGISTQVHIRQYDKFSNKGKCLQRIEFQTSNICNLACDMCSGMLSSSVALKKEHYSNNIDNSISLNEPSFVEILKNLKEAQFSGGEPFLVNSYKNIWKFLIKNNHNCKIIVQTNGTVLNKEIIEAGNFHINISIDSITPGRYEEIRTNASLDKVFENLNYFRQYMKKRKRTIALAVCLMPSNYKEIPSIIDYCNKNGMEILFNTVFFPAREALWLLSSNELNEIHSYFKNNKPTSTTKISKGNLIAFNEQTEYIKQLSDKARHFEQGIVKPADKVQTKEQINLVLKKLLAASEKRGKSNDPVYKELISYFNEIVMQEPFTEHKFISLQIMNKYDDDLLLSNLFRESKKSLQKIVTRLSILASIK